jgi:hypothetical protein
MGTSIQAAIDAARRLEADLRNLRDYAERGNSELLHVLLIAAGQELCKVKTEMDCFAREQGLTVVTVIEGRRA